MKCGAGTNSPQESKVGKLIIHLWRPLGPQNVAWLVWALLRMARKPRVGRPWSADFRISKLAAGLEVLGKKTEIGLGWSRGRSMQKPLSRPQHWTTAGLSWQVDCLARTQAWVQPSAPRPPGHVVQ